MVLTASAHLSRLILWLCLLAACEAFQPRFPLSTSQIIVSHSSLNTSTCSGDEDDFDHDDFAISQFGTRAYWDELYSGQGSFPQEEYSWYFGWEILESVVTKYIPLLNEEGDPSCILCPGIGNDPLLVDLYRSKYTKLTAFDYSEHAIERQNDILSFELPNSAMDTIDLEVMDARKLALSDCQFDAVLEKGALDAIYLSGEGNVERAIKELFRVLKPGGICLSVSGVVPQDLRRACFEEWEWLRDGSDELKAGCFVLRKPIEIGVAH